MWPVNLRVYPPKKLDLRVARKSTTSPIPANSRQIFLLLELHMHVGPVDSITVSYTETVIQSTESTSAYFCGFWSQSKHLSQHIKHFPFPSYVSVVGSWPHLHPSKQLPWIFPGAPLKINGAPGNILGNLTGTPRIFGKIPKLGICQKKAGIGLMRSSSAQLQPSFGTLWHFYRDSTELKVGVLSQSLLCNLSQI